MGLRRWGESFALLISRPTGRVAELVARRQADRVRLPPRGQRRHLCSERRGWPAAKTDHRSGRRHRPELVARRALDIFHVQQKCGWRKRAAANLEDARGRRRGRTNDPAGRLRADGIARRPGGFISRRMGVILESHADRRRRRSASLRFSPEELQPRLDGRGRRRLFAVASSNTKSTIKFFSLDRGRKESPKLTAFYRAASPA